MSWYLNSLFAQAQAQAPAAIPGYVHLLVAVGTMAISVFLGNYLAKKLRMADHGWKISVILFSLLASVAVLLMGPPIKLGVDLSGGAILVYEVDQSKKTNAGESLDGAQMDKLIAAISRRVNPGGQKEVVVRPYGKEQVEIIVPEKDDAEVKRIEWIISQAGNLEFRILANMRDNKDLIERAVADPSKNRLFDSEGKLEAWWIPVKPGEESSIASYGDVGLRTRKKGDREILEVLVLADDYNVTGSYLTRADTGTDRSGRPCVNFTFNAAGGQLFGAMTGTHLPDKLTNFSYKLGIVLDEELYSAPGIQSTIFDRGEITGSFTQDEVQDLVNVLNAGSLPAALTKEPISKLFSGPTLGQDTIDKSKKAILISVILVPLFMLWYYRFSGIVANVALVLNMLILFAIMLAFKAPFTLTGFAGLALTVGMAVDNNVLVFERLREELDRGATLRMAIRNAFQRASATIIDANLTTLIAATVMYVIGTDQIKGFAVPLWLGVAISMYTSVFVSRVIFDVAEKRGWITKVKMLRVIGHTDIDFMKLFPYTLTMSILITVMAIAVSFYRGQGLFDIDFTGGVSVQAVFNEPQDTNTVREMLNNRPETERLPDLSITDVQMMGQERGLQFVVTTSEPSLKNVEQELSNVFAGKLARNTLEFTPPAAIPTAPEAKEKDAEKKPAEAEKSPAGAEAVEVPGAKPPARKPLPSEAEKAKDGGETAPAKADAYAGGTVAQLTFAIPVAHETARELVLAMLPNAEMSEDTPFELSNEKYNEDDRGGHEQWTLKIMAPPDKVKTLLDKTSADVASSPIFPASSEIGSAVAGNTRLLAVYALVVSWLCIIIYLWIRFQGAAFGIAAVAALVHDIFIMLGAIAVSIYLAPFLGFLLIEPFKINLTIVAAFLTIIGFSVNDTIVIFDRIREVRGKNPNVTRKMVNDSVNQTLARTLLTSFTVLLVDVVLYLFGGEAIHGFAFVLLVGVATGTYSSVYIASPILLWLVGKRHHVAALIERK